MTMRDIRISITRPDDTGQKDLVEFQLNTPNLCRTGGGVISPIHGGNDPILDGMRSWVMSSFFGQGRRRSRYSTMYSVKSIPNGILIQLYGCPLLITHGSRVSINGFKHSVANAVNILSRMFLKAIREKDGAKLMMYLANLNKLPENVTYALENRTPFNFWNDYQKHEVRLNVQLIGDNEIAIEVSDGVWGTMTVKQLDAFVNAHRNDSKRSKWAFMSPRQLYIETVGKEPLDSEVKVMKSFLLQNRTSELVESRARELVYDMVKKYPNRLRITEEDGAVTEMFVRGKQCDWKLTCGKGIGSVGGRQDVKTYVYSKDSDGGGTYRGPICIDNLGNNSSVGDQYVARALALLNDNIVIKMVNTIRSYISAEEIRDENNGLPGMQQ